ncbi:unnamed protein product [Camellia sinensis]
MWDYIEYPFFYIGVTKRRKCSVGLEKMRWVTSLVFHEVTSTKLVVLIGAGISTECGIPDYRREFLRLTRARRRYWAKSYARWRRFTTAQPGPAHIALSSLEKTSWINFMITQNVDRLHHSAGSNPLELHGTIYNVVCIDCSFRCYNQLFEDQLKALNPK